MTRIGIAHVRSEQILSPREHATGWGDVSQVVRTEACP